MAVRHKNSGRKHGRGRRHSVSKTDAHVGIGTTPGQQSRPKRRNRAVPDLPPNENLEKHPDEAYGDTEIPERSEEL